ncbi:MAG: DUF72 domain-containing protein [Bacteroidota bacterium]
MKFGKLLDLNGVDWALPADHPRTGSVLAASPRPATQPLRIYLGATGWSNKEWVGTWYPKGTKAANYLNHYSRQFNTIEFNTTHYRIPSADLVARWYAGAQSGFRFCPKVPQQISHRARLQAEDATIRFVEVLRGLGEKLGPIFLQLPDYHGPEQAQLVLDFLRDWPADLGLYFEFRHPDWFNGSHPGAQRVFDALEAAGQGMVVTDVGGRRDVLHMELTNSILVLRFVGNGLHPSDYTRTDEWVERLQEWNEAGLREAYLFLHQPEMEQVPEFTAYWAQALNGALGGAAPIPRKVLNGGQQSLF